MATFPATLPVPSHNGYQLAPADQTVRTDMEVGAARQRRRTTARNDQISLTWIFTDAEMAVFRAWFDDSDEAAGGAAWFTGLYLALGETGLTSAECRFNGPYSASAMPGLNWTVTAKLEVR
jgi:hypothetical protein